MTVSEQTAAAPRALPPPAIDPNDLIAVMPSLDAEDAARYCSLATLAVSSAIWPRTIPEPPPPPMYVAILSVATRFAAAGETGGGQPVVSESIGAYSYRLAQPPTPDAVLALTDAERAQLSPWLPSGVLELDTSGRPSTSSWPIDWWQRNYDNPIAQADAAEISWLSGMLIPGPPGPAGPAGPPGPPGAGLTVGEWLYSTTTSPPPATGQVRLDNADQRLATSVAVSYLTSPGSDLSAALLGANPGGLLRIQDKDDSTRFVVYRLTGSPTDEGTYVAIPVTLESSGLDLPAQRVLIGWEIELA